MDVVPKRLFSFVLQHATFYLCEDMKEMAWFYTRDVSNAQLHQGRLVWQAAQFICYELRYFAQYIFA